MLELLQQGFGAVFSLNILILMFLGVAVGIVFGAVPGLSATMAVALCLPLTFTMGPQAGLSLLVALFIGATSGGLISAILLKIPGTPSSIATVFDGGPLMEQGLGVKALGVGIVFSSRHHLQHHRADVHRPAAGQGGAELRPARILRHRGVLPDADRHPVGRLDGQGLFAGTLGIAVSTVGIAPVEAVRRFLRPQRTERRLLHAHGDDRHVRRRRGHQARRNRAARRAQQVGSVSMKHIKGFGFAQGVPPGAAQRQPLGPDRPGGGHPAGHRRRHLQPALLHRREEARQAAGNLWQGNIGGVVASETANNAGIGGAMMPLMTLGIPGDTTTAILLGGFLIHGIQPAAAVRQPGPLVYTSLRCWWPR